MFGSRRRSVLGLLGSWIAYWLIVATIKLGPMILAIWRATRSGDPNSASVSANLATMVLNVVVTDHGRETWNGSVHLAVLALWIAGIPLLLTFLWARSARATADTPPSDLAEADRVPAGAADSPPRPRRP